MDNPKYIVADSKAYVFSCSIDHAQFAKRLGLINITGAGFVSVSQTGVDCYGKSVSLDIKSSSDDSLRVSNMLTKGY